MNYGRHPSTPSSLMAGSDSPVQSVKEMLAGLASVHKSARDNLLRAQQRQAANADSHRRDVTFVVGDQVLIDAAVLRSDYDADRPTPKLAHKWVGPFPVTAVNRTTVTVTLPANSRAWNVFHVSEVRHYVTPVDSSTPRPPPDRVDDASGDVHYVVERIIDKRTKGRGRSTRVEYLVKWEGYPDHESTWQGLDDLEDAMDAVQDYEARVLGVMV